MSAPWEDFQQQSAGPWNDFYDSAQPTQNPPSESLGQTVMDSAKQVLSAPVNAAKSLTPENMSPYLPAAGAVIGSAFAPGLGTAAGAGLGQIGKRMADLAYGKAQPGDAMNPGQEAISPMAQTAAQGIAEYPPVQNAVSTAANAVGRGASRVGEALSGVPARDIQNLFQNPGTLFTVGSKGAAGQAIGDAKALAGVNPGVTEDSSTFTPENISKALNVKSTGEDALNAIAANKTGTPEQLGDALKYVSDQIKTRLSTGQDASELINIQNHLNNMLDQVAPGVQEARQAYAPLAQRNKFLQLAPVNKNGTVSKANLLYLSSLLGGLGSSVGGVSGAAEAIGAGAVARAPITTGVVTSGAGALNNLLSNPQARQALLATLMSKYAGQSQGQQ